MSTLDLKIPHPLEKKFRPWADEVSSLIRAYFFLQSAESEALLDRLSRPLVNPYKVEITEGRSPLLLIYEASRDYGSQGRVIYTYGKLPKNIVSFEDFFKNLSGENLDPGRATTSSYQFGVRSLQLESVSQYKGDFTEKGFRWGRENRELDLDIHQLRTEPQQRREAYATVERIVEHLAPRMLTQTLLGHERERLKYFFEPLKRIIGNRS